MLLFFCIFFLQKFMTKYLHCMLRPTKKTSVLHLTHLKQISFMWIFFSYLDIFAIKIIVKCKKCRTIAIFKWGWVTLNIRVIFCRPYLNLYLTTLWVWHISLREIILHLQLVWDREFPPFSPDLVRWDADI